MNLKNLIHELSNLDIPNYFFFGVSIIALIFAYLFYKENQRKKQLLSNPFHFLPKELDENLIIHTKIFDKVNNIVIGKVENPNMNLRRKLINDRIHIIVDEGERIFVEKNYEIKDGKFVLMTH
ncbi:MAG: hypothetical protein QG566_248 [Patescibacteria group bacterium]|jgi:hypothetical protein|nr:hypothetical protein [Patescibacteria group bacterium]